MLEEKISKHLGKPYVYLPDQKKFLCSNGVLFTLEEYKNGIDVNTEYERREKEDKLYDYNYAKTTGKLRKKKTAKTTSDGNIQPPGHSEGNTGRTVPGKTGNDLISKIETKDFHTEKGAEGSLLVRPSEQSTRLDFTFVIGILLAFTSIISGYISTLQTALYLYDYVDIVSAWLMSASVTAYNVTAFEVAVIFKQNRRYGLTFVFITLWITVTLFSMATAVSVFYDRFNFNESVIAEENKAVDSGKLAVQVLQKKEGVLQEAIAFKKKDIEYRQEHDYATTAVRLELENLQKELQENLSEQQKILSDVPEVTETVTKKKEKLFAFLGRIMHIDSGIFEFMMSTLSAIFVNLISPMSIVAVAELKKKRLDKTN